jgi:hypothetical protein
MGLCRVCGNKYNGEKWYYDKDLDTHRRSCCLGIIYCEEEEKKWKAEIEEHRKRIMILKNGLKYMLQNKGK